MGAEVPNDASAQKAGSAEYDDGVLFRLAAIVHCINRLCLLLWGVILSFSTRTSLSVDLPEHDVERSDDRRDVGKHMPAAQEVHRLQMGE